MVRTKKQSGNSKAAATNGTRTPRVTPDEPQNQPPYEYLDDASQPIFAGDIVCDDGPTFGRVVSLHRGMVFYKVFGWDKDWGHLKTPESWAQPSDLTVVDRQQLANDPNGTRR